MELTTKTLLIGCGGSGIETLIRLNQFLSSNIDFRENMAEKIAYMVLDTNEADLTKFYNTIKYQMGHATMPVVKQVHITDGCSQLNDIVEDTFDKFSGKQDITDLMKRYWWYSKDGEPFRGEEIQDLASGAGQCCQISFLAAWKSMEDIEEQLRELLQDNLIRDINNTESLEKNLKVYIVAGLAGGTGRGSWTLVAFKVREFLLKMRLSKVRIEGVFFDASCYENRYKGDPAQKLSMCINSATGVSELSSWLQLRKVPAQKLGGLEKKFFSLPSLYHPMTDRTNDVISFRQFLSKDINLVPPVQGAYLVFGESDTLMNLKDNLHYHNMAAAALYAKIVNAGKINEGTSNMRSQIGSFASTTFAIDSYRIETYLNTAVQKIFLEDLWADADPELEQKVKETAGTAKNLGKDAFEKSFLGKSHLRIPDNLSFGQSDVMSDKTSLLGTLMAFFREDQTTGLNPDEKSEQKYTKLTMALQKDIKGQNPKNASKRVEKLHLSDLKDSTISKYFNEVLEMGKLSGSNLSETLCEQVMDQFVQGSSLSLRRAVLYTDELIQTFTRYCATLNSKVTVNGDEIKDASGLIEKFKKLVEDKAKTSFWENVKGIGLFADPFNKKEIAFLCDQYEVYLQAAVFFRIKGELLKFFKTAVEVLTGIKESLTLMGTLLNKASEKLNGNLTTVFPNTSYNDIFDELFTDPTKPGKVQKAIPEFDATETLYHRQLKPVLTEDELHELLVNPENRYAHSDPITATIRAELKNLLDLLSSDPAKAKDRVYATQEKARSNIPTNIQNVVMSNVGLSVDSSNRSFTDRHFSFEAVLNRNIAAWNQLLRNNPNALNGSLFDQLREYLGVDKNSPQDFIKNEETGKLEIDSEKVIEKVILSLAKTCKPWINIKEPRPISCLIVVPFKLSKYEVKEKDLEKALQAVFKARKDTFLLKVLDAENQKNVRLPQDRILVYSSKLLGYGSDLNDDQVKDDNKKVEEEDPAPIEKIRSLDYWKDYIDQLVLAEDLNHDSSALFYSKDDYWMERARGFAYLAPFYTMEPFKSLRWHPWIKEETNPEQDQLESVYKALFYAFLGHNLTEATRAAVEPYGWDKPLLEMGADKEGGKKSRESFTFSRKQQEWKVDKMVEIRASAWRAGSELANSIDQVVEFLNGEGLRSLRDNAGADLEKSKKKGVAIRCAILKEAESFLLHMPKEIGNGRFNQIVDQCCDWIDEKKAACKDSSDLKCWEALSEYAENELKKRTKDE